MKEFIKNTFQASNCRHLLLTGTRGAGKSTLLAGLFGENTPKITTWAVPEEGVYLRVNPLQRTWKVGVFDPGLPGPENRMAPLSFPVEAVRALADAPGEWAVVDEIGYLEFACPDYLQALWQLGRTKRLALAVRKEVADKIPLQDVFRVDLDDPAGNTGCVIMASGLGQRFGGNKLLAPFRGRPMVQWILDASAAFSHRVVVTRHQEIARLCRTQGIACVLHDLPHRSDTVRLGLEALNGVDRCMFCPADQPLLTGETLLSLALLSQEGQHIWRPRCGAPGAPVVFPQWAFEALKSLPQGKGGGYVAESFPEKVRYLDIHDPRQLQDADTPQLLRQLEE